MLFRALLSVFVVSLLLQACVNNKRDQLFPTIGNCDTSGITYSGYIKQVTATKCALSGCHNAATASGGVVLETYAGVKDATSGGRLIGAITHSTGFTPMPEPLGSPQLDACTIAKISKWVADGALNN